MRCANCGKGVFGAAKVCPFCHQPITAAARNGAASAAAPVAKTKIARWAIVLGGVVATAVVASFMVVWATSDLIKPIQRQLDALKHEDLLAAYDETSTAFHKDISFEKFSEFVRSTPSLSHNASYRFTSRSMSSSGETGTGELKGSLTDDRGGVQPVMYTLVKEDGSWKIRGIHLGKRIAAQSE